MIENLSSFWILDLGCSAHMTSQKELLASVRNHKGVVIITNGCEIPVEDKGNLILNLRTSTGKNSIVSIRDVLYVPQLKGGHLISESKLDLEGYKIVSENGRRRILLNEQEWMFATLDSSKQFVIQEIKYNYFFTSYMEAYKSFGHSGENFMSTLRKLYPKIIPKRLEEFYCPACILSKSIH